MNKVVKKQIIGYVISGLLATGTDFIIYHLLSSHVFGYNLSKTISFLMGTLVAFFYNKYITFNAPDKSISEVVKFFTLYVVSMVFNVVTNHFSIVILSKISYAMKLVVLTSFILATMVSMIINFFGQKFWVFTNKIDSGTL